MISEHISYDPLVSTCSIEWLRRPPDDLVGPGGVFVPAVGAPVLTVQLEIEWGVNIWLY